MHDRQRREFEVRQRDWFGQTQTRRFDRFEMRQEISVACLRAVHTRPLVEREQVRRRVATHAVTGAQQDRFEDRAGRALAVGAAHRDHRTVERQLQRVAHLADPRQTHVNADRMRGFKVRKPSVESGECGHRMSRLGGVAGLRGSLHGETAIIPEMTARRLVTSRGALFFCSAVRRGTA